MNRVRVGAVLAATALTLTSWIAEAAPNARPQVTDPAGDALLPGFDIVSAQLSTTGVHGVSRRGGRAVKTYTPKHLIATVTLSEPPSTIPGTTIELYVDSTACNNGTFQFMYTPGNSDMVANNGDLKARGCVNPSNGGDTYFVKDVHAVVKGKTITWTLPISTLGPDLPLGSVFRNFRVHADLNEPAFNIFGTATGSGHIDYATGAATWKLS